MAKIDLKKPIDTSWAREAQEDRLYPYGRDYANKQAEASAIVQAIADDNPNLTGEQLAEIFSKIMAGEEFDVAAIPPAPAPAETGEAPAREEPSSLSSLLGSSVALPLTAVMPTLAPILTNPGARDALGELTAASQDPKVREYATTVAEAGNAAKDLAKYEAESRGLSLGDNSAMLELIGKGLSMPFQAQETLESLFLPGSARERLAEVRKQDAAAKLEQASGRIQELEQELGGKYGVGTTVARAVGGMISQPEQLGSVVGGLAGGAVTRTPSGAAVGSALLSVPMAETVYNAAIQEASQFGDENNRLTNEELNEYALMQVAAELGPDVAFSVFGAGLTGILNKWGPTRLTSDAIRSAVQRSLVAKGALAVGAGGLSEVVAEEAGLRAQEFMGETISNDVVSRDIAQASAEERARGLERFIDPAVGGALQAGVISGPAIGAGHVRQQQEAEAYTRALEDFLNSGAQNIQDAAARANELAQSIKATRRQEQEAAETAADEQIIQEIAQEQERIRNEQKAAEEDAAWEQRNLERARESNQQDVRRNLERSIDEARQDVEVLQDAVEDGARDSQTLNDLAAATRRLREREESLAAYDAAEQASTGQEAMTPPPPEPAPDPEVIAEQTRRAEEQAERERQERAEQGKRIEAIRKRQEELRKKEEKEQQKKQKAAESEATRRRNAITDEVIAENPNATPAELDALIEARVMEPAPDPRPAQEREALLKKIRSARGRINRKAKPSQQAEAKRIESWLRRNPDATDEAALEALSGNSRPTPAQPAPVRTPTQQATLAPQPAPAITKPDSEINDSDIDNMARMWEEMAQQGESLGMASDSPARTREQPQDAETPLVPEIDMEDFKARTKQFVRGLVSRARGDSRSVQQMIWNGQLAFVPSAASIGRNTDNVAEYDIETGQMFLYADKLKNPGDAVAAIARAFHEATHAGQFNDREGRSNLFRHFLGDGKVQKSASTIRKAAANNNAVAKRALNKAQLDSFSRAVGRGEQAAVEAMRQHNDNLQAAKDAAYDSISDAAKQFEDLEVVGYFTSEVVESRRGTLGTVGGVVRDITTGAREFLRDNLGMDLDITINDLATAAANVGSEIVQTRVGGLSSNPNVLGMIYNIDPDNLTPQQQQAIDNGYVYDSVDGTQKYVLTDEGSSIREGAAERLRRANVPIPLSEVLSHPVLFEQSPDTADIPVYAVDELLGDRETLGLYMPVEREIYVNKSLLSDPDRLRGTLLHEVQHYLQDVAGLSHQFYDSNNTRARRQEVQDALRDRAEALDNAARTFLDTAPQMLTGPERSRVMRIFMRNDNASDSALAAKIRDFILGLENPSPEALAAIDSYEQARRAYNEYIPTYRDAVEQAHADYLSNITEREAHFTQYNMDNNTTGINPEPVMRGQEADPETGVDLTRGRIDVPDGRGNTVPLSAGNSFLGMASDSVYRSFEFRRNKQIEQELAAMYEELDAQNVREAVNSALDTITSSMDALPSIMATARKIDALENAGFYVEGPDEVTQDQFVSRVDSLNANYVQMLEVMDKDYPTEIARVNELSRIAFNVQLLTEEVQDIGRRYLRSAANTRAELNTRTRAGKEQARRYDEAIPNEVVALPRRSPILGMAAVDAGAADYSPTNSPAFREWFGDSQIRDARGNPQVYYHGTKHYFDKFMPNSLGLIFASPDQMFAEAFAGIDEYSLTQRKAIPLYIRAENPWDFDNSEHIENLLNHPIDDVRFDTIRDFVHDYYSRVLSPEEAEAKLRKGDWSLIETPEIIEAIRELGHDGVFVYEPSAKNIAVFTPNQLKHATDNKGAWSREDDSFLGMAADGPTQRRASLRAVDAIAPDSRFGDWLRDKGHITARAATGLIRNDRGLGKGVLEAWEFAKQTPAADEARANASLGKYEEALSAYATQNGTTFDAVNNQIMEELDAIDNPDLTYSQSMDAWKEVLSKYGPAGQHLLDLRSQVDKMSFEMLRQLHASNTKVSPAMAKQYAYIARNLGRYTHRMYAAHMGEVGEKYGRSMMRAWKKMKQGDKELTPAQQKAAAVVDTAIQVLINDHLLIPDDAGLSEMNAEALRRLYGTWGRHNDSAPTADEMIEELSSIRDSINGDTNRLNNTAEQITRDLLGLLSDKNATAIGSYYRGGKQDLTILQHRKRIPVELRTLMGEITDPGVRMLATVAKQSEFIARTRLHEELKQKAAPRDLQPPDATGSQIVLDNDMVKLSGEGYGSLEGWYASPNMKSLLDDVRETMTTLEQAATITSNKPDALPKAVLNKAFSTYTGIAATSKGLQIVGNTFLYPLNGLGAISSLARNGNTNVRAWNQGRKDAMAIIGYAMNARRGLGDAEIAVRYGITDSATVGEFRGIPYRKLQDAVREMAGESDMVRWAKRMYSTGKLTLPEVYAMTDVWAKIANFHNEVAVLRDFYKKDGQTKSDEEIYREAAEKTKRTNITWQRALPLMKALERGGITHFGVYFWETFRTEIYNAAEAIHELNRATDASTPEARNVMLARGLKRLGGQAAVWGFWGTMTKLLNEFVFGDDDDEARKIRELFPSYMQDQDLFPVGLDEDGNPIYIALSRLDPQGPVTDIMRKAMVGEFDYDEAKKTLLDMYVMPRILPRFIEAAAATFSDERVYREPLIKQRMPNGYAHIAEAARALGMSDNTLNAYVNAAESAWLPGTFNAYRDTNPVVVAPDPKLEGASEVTKIMSSMARYFGATFVKAQPDNNMRFAFRDFNDQVKRNRNDLLQFFSNTPNASTSSTANKMLDLVAQEKEQWEKLHKIYEGMQASGMKRQDIDTILTERVDDKRVREQLRSGKFAPISISERSLKTARQNELKGKSKKEQEEINAKWDAILETFKSAQGEIK